MRNNRMLMSLIFALSGGAVACGGANDQSVDDTAESLRRGQLSDGGAVADRSDDSDEASEEALEGDAGHHRGDRAERGDGGCGRLRGEHAGRGEKDEDRGGKDEDDLGDKGEEDHSGKGDGKLHGDGGFWGSLAIDGGVHH